MVRTAITNSAKAPSDGIAYAAESKKSTNAENFGAVMAKSLGNSVSAGNKTAVKGTAVQAAEKMPQQGKETAASQKDAVQKASAKDTGEQISQEKESACGPEEKVEKTDAADEKDALQKAEGFAEEAKAAGKSIYDKIKELLGVSDEELEDCIEKLGLNLIGLLEPANVIRVAMELTGTIETMELVTDENLSSALKDLLDLVGGVTDELTQKLDVKPQEFDAMLQSAMEAHEAPVSKETAVESADEEISKERINQTEGQQDATMEEVVASKLTVSKETEAFSKGESGGRAMQEEQQQSKTDVSAISMNNAAQGNPVQQLSQTFEEVFRTEGETVNPADVVKQIVDSIRMTHTQTLQSMEIQLNPEHLGKVNVVVSVRHGIVTAEIATQNEQVRRAVESQVATLKENFENQGIKVEAVEVTVHSNAFESNAQFNDQNRQESTSKAKKHLRPEDLNLDGEEEPVQEPSVLTSENSSVEYSA